MIGDGIGNGGRVGSLRVFYSLSRNFVAFGSFLLCLVFVVLALYLFAAFLIRKCKKKYLQLYVHKYIGDVQADICLVCLSTLVENTDRTFSEREEEAQTPLQTNKVTKSQF